MYNLLTKGWRSLLYINSRLYTATIQIISSVRIQTYIQAMNHQSIQNNHGYANGKLFHLFGFIL
ncbi:hypothetical protein DERF_006956, partial [Dermatophagoides farinae]